MVAGGGGEESSVSIKSSGSSSCHPLSTTRGTRCVFDWYLQIVFSSPSSSTAVVSFFSHKDPKHKEELIERKSQGDNVSSVSRTDQSKETKTGNKWFLWLGELACRIFPCEIDYSANLFLQRRPKEGTDWGGRRRMVELNQDLHSPPTAPSLTV